MTAPIIGLRRPSSGAAAPGTTAPGQTARGATGRMGFRLLGWFGVALAIIALSDAALAFVPALWGNAEWLFGTGVQLVSGLPVLAVALGAMTAGAFGAGGVGAVRVAGALNALLVLAIAAVLVPFVPAALEALEVVAAAGQPGIRKMIVRVALYAAVFGALHLTLAIACLRGARQLAADQGVRAH